MSNFIFDAMQADDFENIFFCQEKTFGLKAIIAIHDTTLGPAAGGIRMRPYESEQEAIYDAMRLARAMTYKNAAAELAIGGGKCVIIGILDEIRTRECCERLPAILTGLEACFWQGRMLAQHCTIWRSCGQNHGT